MGIFMHKVQRLCSKRNNNLQLNRDNCPIKCGHPADLEHCEEIIRVRILVISVLDIDKKCKMYQQRREKMSKVTDDSWGGELSGIQCRNRPSEWQKILYDVVDICFKMK